MSIPIWGIDPGSETCGLCLLARNGTVIETSIESIDNVCRLVALRSDRESDLGVWADAPIAVEWIESFSMRVGRDVFETVYNIGRIAESAGLNIHRVTRREVKIALVGNARAGDADVRLAICEMYGGKAKAIGTKKEPGPLYGVKGHCWSALAVALAWKMKMEGSDQIEIAVSGS